MSDQNMADVSCASSSEGGSSSCLEASSQVKKRGLAVRTIDRWIRDNDKVLNTAAWLTYDKLNREFVNFMKCSVCIKFKDKLVSCRNFSSAFIDGSRNLSTLAFKNHARSSMHQMAMRLLRRASAKEAPPRRATLTDSDSDDTSESEHYTLNIDEWETFIN